MLFWAVVPTLAENDTPEIADSRGKTRPYRSVLRSMKACEGPQRRYEHLGFF